MPHFKKKIGKVFDSVQETAEEKEIRDFARDPMITAAINAKRDEYQKKPDWTVMF